MAYTSRPPHDADASRLEQGLADWGHRLLYALLIAVPVTGWWISDTSRIPFKLFGSVPVPDLMDADKASSELAASVHEFLTISLVVLVGVHVAAALRHHFMLKNDTLKRMLPWQ